jgi:hypothetical protein
MARLTRVLAVMLLGLGLATTAALAQGRWQEYENKTGCAVWNPRPEPNETVSWTGDCGRGQAQGYGVETWRSVEDGEARESRYVGTMRDGKKEGRGVFTHPGGNRYDGEYRTGRRHGRGTAIFANGNKCAGEWREGLLLGTGKGWVESRKKATKCYSDGGTVKFVD